MSTESTEFPEFLSLTGKKEAVIAIESSWQQLTAPEALCEPTLEVDRLPESMLIAMGIEPKDVQFEFGSVHHAPGIGQVLLRHLKTECEQQLGLMEPDIILEQGYYFKPS